MEDIFTIEKLKAMVALLPRYQKREYWYLDGKILTSAELEKTLTMKG